MYRKSLVYLFILFCFFLSGSIAPLRAADADNADLIKLLKEKNILTDQEADQLNKEIEKSKKEKAEKEAARAAAAEAITFPPALKGFKFGTTIFGEWNNINPSGTVPGANTGSSNQFVLNRAYLTLTKDINEWLSMNITADLFKDSSSDDAGNGYELRLKYAYLNFKYLSTNTQFGMIGTPSDAYDSAIWPYRVQGKHLLDELGIHASADFGISNAGVIGGYMDEDYLKFASKPFAGKWGGWMIGLYNGPGYTSSESNNNKVVSGLVYVRPLPETPVLKGLQLAYTGTYGKSNTNFATGVTTDYPDWEANIAQASLQHKWFTVMGQYYWGKATATATEENKRKAWLVDAFVRVPELEKARVFGKWYTYDPNTDVDNNSYDTTVVGVSYDVSKEFMPFVAWEHRAYETQTASTHNYDKYQVGFQLKF